MRYYRQCFEFIISKQILLQISSDERKKAFEMKLENVFSLISDWSFSFDYLLEVLRAFYVSLKKLHKLKVIGWMKLFDFQKLFSLTNLQLPIK